MISFCEDFIDTRDPVDVQNLYSIMTMTLGEDVENARVGNLTDNICYWMQSSWGGTAFERLSGIIYNKHWGTCFTSDYQQSLEYVKNSTFYDQGTNIVWRKAILWLNFFSVQRKCGCTNCALNWASSQQLTPLLGRVSSQSTTF